MPRKIKINPRRPPRAPLMAMLPLETARNIMVAADIEGWSVSRVMTDTLVAVFGPFEKRKGTATSGARAGN